MESELDFNQRRLQQEVEAAGRATSVEAQHVHSQLGFEYRRRLAGLDGNVAIPSADNIALLVAGCGLIAPNG